MDVWTLLFGDAIGLVVLVALVKLTVMIVIIVLGIRFLIKVPEELELIRYKLENGKSKKRTYYVPKSFFYDIDGNDDDDFSDDDDIDDDI